MSIFSSKQTKPITIVRRRTLKQLLVILLIIGIVTPYFFLISYVNESGFDLLKIYNEITVSRLAVFGWLDVIISAITLLVFTILIRTSPIKTLAVFLLTLFVGVSAGLPLFLYFLVDSNDFRNESA